MLRTAAIVIVAINVVAVALAIPAELLAGGGRAEVVPLLMLSGVTSMLSALSQIPQAELIVEQRLGQLTRLTITAAASSTLLMAIGTVIGGLRGQFIGATLGASVMLALFWAFGIKRVPVGSLIEGRFALGFLKQALKLGTTSLIAGAAAQAALTGARVGIERELGTAANGLFQAAWGLNATAFAAVTGGLANYAFPRFAAAPDAATLSAEIERSLAFILRLVIPIALVGLALHDAVVPVLFSARFDGASPVIALLIVGNVPRAAAWVTSGPLMYRGRVAGFLLLELIAAITLGLAIPFLLPRFGLLAVGVVYVTNATAQVILATVVLRRVERVTVPWRGLGVALVGATASLGVAGWMNEFPALRWLALGAGVTLLARGGRSFLKVRGRAAAPIPEETRSP